MSSICLRRAAGADALRAVIAEECIFLLADRSKAA